MPPAIKVDEDLPTGAADVLREAGYEASTVHDQGLTGYDDARLWDVVQSEARLLVTADKGFGNARVHAPGTHHGVVLLRLDNESRRGYIDLVRRLLASTNLEQLVGTIAVATPDRLRVRRR